MHGSALDYLSEAAGWFGINSCSAGSMARVAGTIACLAEGFDAEPHDVSETSCLLPRLRQTIPA